MGEVRESQQYHEAHLAFSRATIVKAAADRHPILDRLKTYTEDVIKAERDRHAGAVEEHDAYKAALEEIARWHPCTVHVQIAQRALGFEGEYVHRAIGGQ